MSIEDVLARIAGGGGSGRGGTNVLDPGDTARGGERGSAILSLLDAKTQIWLKEISASPYFQRAEEALHEICNHGHYLTGALCYFRAAHPDRAKQLEADLWQEIDRLWDEGAPIDEFQATLDRWVQLHREACDLFIQAIKAGDEVALAAKTVWNEDVENEDLE